jgi:hypothetical protein
MTSIKPKPVPRREVHDKVDPADDVHVDELAKTALPLENDDLREKHRKSP